MGLLVRPQIRLMSLYSRFQNAPQFSAGSERVSVVKRFFCLGESRLILDLSKEISLNVVNVSVN